MIGLGSDKNESGLGNVLFQNVHNSKRLQLLLTVVSPLAPTLVNDYLWNFCLVVKTYRLVYLTVPPKRFDL